MGLLGVTCRAVSGDVPCSGDLCSFVVTLLAERGQQHDPVVFREAVRDTPSCRTEREAEFEQPGAECPRERHSGSGTDLDESLNDDHRTVPVVLRQGREPFSDFRVELQFRDALIIAQRRSSHKSDDGYNGTNSCTHCGLRLRPGHFDEVAEGRSGRCACDSRAKVEIIAKRAYPGRCRLTVARRAECTCASTSRPTHRRAGCHRRRPRCPRVVPR